MTTEPNNIPDFVFQETQYFGSNGRIVLRRHVVAGKEPELWREFLGVTVVELPIGNDESGKTLTKKHEIVFPFFGISTHVHKAVLKCVNECFKAYDEVEQAAQRDTIEHYKAAVREHLAKASKIEETAAAEGKSLIIPGRSAQQERHLDRDGNEIAAPAQPKKSIILGG